MLIKEAIEVVKEVMIDKYEQDINLTGGQLDALQTLLRYCEEIGKENEELKEGIRQMYECKYEPDKLLCLRDHYLKVDQRQSQLSAKFVGEEEIEKILSDVVNKGLMDNKDTATIIKEQAHSIAQLGIRRMPDKDKLTDIILKVAMAHHDDISKQDEDSAVEASEAILNEMEK